MRRFLIAGLLLVLLQLGCGSSTPATHGVLDIRGQWAEVAVANGAQYPQTLHLTTEDLSTGKFSGNDVGSGLTFTVTGTVSGSTATFLTTEVGGGYTSNATGTIAVAADGSALTMTGTFHDSNQTTGTFTAKRTSP